MKSNALLLALCLLTTLTLAGCEAAGWAAHAVTGGQRTTQVKAEYPHLAGKRVAVVVGAAEPILLNQPQAAQSVGKAVGRQLAANVEGLELIDPRTVHRFQQQNPYWMLEPYGRLTEALGADAVIVIDLLEYSTHEPGNAHVWRGQATARLELALAGAPDATRAAYARTISVRFPEDSSLGLVDASDNVIQLGLLTALSRDITRLFTGYTRVDS